MAIRNGTFVILFSALHGHEMEWNSMDMVWLMVGNAAHFKTDEKRDNDDHEWNGMEWFRNHLIRDVENKSAKQKVTFHFSIFSVTIVFFERLELLILIIICNT